MGRPGKEEGSRPPPHRVVASSLTAELAILRALHEGGVQELREIDGLDLVVVDAEDRHGVLHLLRGRRRVYRRDRIRARDEEVVRVVVRRRVVLEVLEQYGRRAVLVLRHATPG